MSAHCAQAQPASAAAPVLPLRYETLRLADGRHVLLRPVQASDAPAEQAFVRALSPTSRLRRFHFGLRELPPNLLNAMTVVDQQHHVAIVAEVVEADAARIVADARYVQGPEPQEAEFGIAVADAWQGAGLGRVLMARLARQARSQGLRWLLGDVLPDNAAMFAIARSLGGRVIASPEGPRVVRVRVDLGR
jgi:GNAT superfamily N-acetyltransferase